VSGFPLARSIESDMPPLHLTVAVCTWNRSALLTNSLEQMTRLTVPPSVTWELVVVNNGSTDATDAVIASFQERLPIRPVFEPTPGLSTARNRALIAATGDYVLWTDDDILVDEDWLAAYARAFRRWPDASVFGGPIEPLFEGEPPDWLPRVLDRIGAVYGRQNLGDQPVALSPEGVVAGPYGGNMAMRREVLLDFRFDPTLGVRHSEYAIGEETDVIRQMLEAGHGGWWTPEPRVTHWIPQESQTLDYVRRWMVGCGRVKGRSPSQGAGASTHDRRYRLVAWFLRHEAQFQLRRHFLPPEAWIGDLIQASQARGRLQVFPPREATRCP
jgi:glucosyl-dolichyl phosphate glucuronosyltransferase